MGIRRLEKIGPTNNRINKEKRGKKKSESNRQSCFKEILKQAEERLNKK